MVWSSAGGKEARDDLKSPSETSRTSRPDCPTTRLLPLTAATNLILSVLILDSSLWPNRGYLRLGRGIGITVLKLAEVSILLVTCNYAMSITKLYANALGSTSQPRISDDFASSPTSFSFDDNVRTSHSCLGNVSQFWGGVRIEYAAVDRRITGVDALHPDLRPGPAAVAEVGKSLGLVVIDGEREESRDNDVHGHCLLVHDDPAPGTECLPSEKNAGRLQKAEVRLLPLSRNVV